VALRGTEGDIGHLHPVFARRSHRLVAAFVVN
jgi:hypothetical protein